MHDLKAIREAPDAFDAGLQRRGLAPRAAEILSIDAQLRALMTEKQQAESTRNQASKAIGQAKAKGDEAAFAALKAEVDRAKAVIDAAGPAESALGAQLQAILESLPNLPAAEAPDGPDETANVELRRWGTPRAFDFQIRDHVDLGGAAMDFESAARMAGARFVALKGPLARLERALTQFMLDVQTEEAGYIEVSPPLLVQGKSLYGTGQLPKFAEDLFKTSDDRWLIPTAEVSLTNLVREQILAEADLPLRLTAATPCFRAEAGSAGRDVRGMIRQHQFIKVELVSITTPAQSVAEHERMTAAAEAILQKLELPYRVMALCTGDMGFSAQKTYDLEVWLPSQQTYREISSCSNCGDFQARRLEARFRPAGEKAKPAYAHTLNGSGLAVGRTLVAVLETYQNADGSITIPRALRERMGGAERIGPFTV